MDLGSSVSSYENSVAGPLNMESLNFWLEAIALVIPIVPIGGSCCDDHQWEIKWTVTCVSQQLIY